jgi:hypothetical protein
MYSHILLDKFNLFSKEPMDQWSKTLYFLGKVNLCHLTHILQIILNNRLGMEAL